MIDLSLPVWLTGKRAQKLKSTCLAWWVLVEGWIKLPLQQMDVDTCSLDILNLIAWQRDITRFKDEPEWLYRARVKHAFVNSQDAGSVEGFSRIFNRLGVGEVELSERTPLRDWDVIVLTVSDAFWARNQGLLDVLIQMYGRTCRRYEWTVISESPMAVTIFEFNEDQQTMLASL